MQIDEQQDMLMEFVSSQRGHPESDLDEEILHGHEIGVPINSIMNPLRLRTLSH
jgi:hypothetical protein